MPFPPSENEPLTVTTRDGRSVCCCVRSVGKQRPHLRWLFSMTIAGDESRPTVFTGPIYIRGEHDDHGAIQALVDDWWELNKTVEEAKESPYRLRPR